MNFNQLQPRTIQQVNQIMTFYRISDIPISEHNQNRLFFIKSLNNYYRYNPNNEHFEVFATPTDSAILRIENNKIYMFNKEITSDMIDKIIALP